MNMCNVTCTFHVTSLSVLTMMSLTIFVTFHVTSLLLLLLSTPLHQRAASRVQHPNHVAANSLSPQVARKGSTLSGFIQRSRLEREVGRDLHSNKWEEVWSCIRQSGQSGEGCRGSPMEKRYETRSGDLFVRSWARVRRVSLDMRSSAGETDGVWSWRTLLGGLWLTWLLTMWLCISLRLDWMRSSQMRSDFMLMLTV